ncbi:ribosome biogenesis GTPase Der [Candidatus Odyssella thessalonicensis]|uniref:ribosome biogenesis GTPase Der n=1 Tax=Candidatus Odyssella thessalonicensis TaxID=84647 RepID=UPI000225C06C|nr:ribosome biogenesis GTPase Der [Candidatus Odyssella thessalonicensis]
MKKIAIIGRPNVGKSTLFNRFAGKRLALVHDMPGMTRDRKETNGKLYDLSFRIIDTAGLADPDTSILTKRMFEQTQVAIEEADLVLFLIDAREGITPYDRDLANLLRRHNKPVIVVANKCEGRHGEVGYSEAMGLALGEVVAISAEHGEGMYDLYEYMAPYFQADTDDLEEKNEADAEESLDQEKSRSLKPLKLAIAGRPNAGKSTLINKLIGEERLLTADMPGVTRDAITIEWNYQGRPIDLIDTAGLRRRRSIDQASEKLAVMDTQRSINFAEVVILVIDATCPFEKQDLTIAYDIISEGRALVLALNKWDLVNDKSTLLKSIQEKLDNQLTQARGIPCIPISAQHGKGLEKLMDAVMVIYETWNRRISTGQLNKWLSYVTENHPAPAVNGRRIRLKYMTQAKTRPPTFAVFASQASQLPDSYSRYLINNLRKDFKLDGIPIRIFVRGGKNPYDDKK